MGVKHPLKKFLWVLEPWSIHVVSTHALVTLFYYFRDRNFLFIITVSSPEIRKRKLATNSQRFLLKRLKFVFRWLEKTLAEVHCSRRRLLWRRLNKFRPTNWYLLFYAINSHTFCILFHILFNYNTIILLLFMKSKKIQSLYKLSRQDKPKSNLFILCFLKKSKIK